MITADSVSKIFTTRAGDTVQALLDIDLAIEHDEFVSIVGPSGCGKSTFLRLVAGLAEPSTGTVTVNGEVVTAPYPDVGFVFQQPVLLPWRNVLENIMFSIEMLGFKERPTHQRRAEELLEIAGLEQFAKKYPAELSGGMQQRVSICRALVHNPRILLMDEPFGALDAMTREEMSVSLLDIWKEYRKTILFVTHSIPEAVLLSDRVVVMSARPGRITEIIDVRLPRPRDITTEADDRFIEVSQRIRQLISAPAKEGHHEVV